MTQLDAGADALRTRMRALTRRMLRIAVRSAFRDGVAPPGCANRVHSAGTTAWARVECLFRPTAPDPSSKSRLLTTLEDNGDKHEHTSTDQETHTEKADSAID